MHGDETDYCCVLLSGPWALRAFVFGGLARTCSGFAFRARLFGSGRNSTAVILVSITSGRVLRRVSGLWCLIFQDFLLDLLLYQRMNFQIMLI